MNPLLSEGRTIVRLEVQTDKLAGIYAVCINCNKRFTSMRGDVLNHVCVVLHKANKKGEFFNEGEIDIEVILSVLNARANHINALEESGPYSIYLTNHL